MAETLHASAHLTGNCPSPSNATGAPDGTWAGPTGSGGEWDSRWALADPVDSLTADATQTVDVRLRKTNHATDPTYTVYLFEAGTEVAQLATGSMSSTTGTDIQVTFNSSQVTAGADVEIRVVGGVGGGKPADRASLQIDGFTWTADTSAAAAPVSELSGSLDVEVDLTGTLNAPTASVPSVTGSLGVAADLGGGLVQPTASVPTITGSLGVEVDLAGTLQQPTSQVPDLSGNLAFEVGLDGTLDVPTATVADVAGSLDVAVDLGGSLSDPGSSVPQVAGTLGVAVDLDGSFTVPIATVPELAGSLGVAVDLGGVLTDPSAIAESGGRSFLGVEKARAIIPRRIGERP